MEISSILNKGLSADKTYSAVFDLLERIIQLTSATLLTVNEATLKK
jgi:hypothetical protein